MLQVNIIRTVEVELENKLRDLQDLAKEETVKLRKWKGCHGDAVKKLQDIHQQSKRVCMHRTCEGCRSHTSISALSILGMPDGKPAVSTIKCPWRLWQASVAVQNRHLCNHAGGDDGEVDKPLTEEQLAKVNTQELEYRWGQAAAAGTQEARCVLHGALQL